MWTFGFNSWLTLLWQQSLQMFPVAADQTCTILRRKFVPFCKKMVQLSNILGMFSDSPSWGHVTASQPGCQDCDTPKGVCSSVETFLLLIYLYALGPWTVASSVELHNHRDQILMPVCSVSLPKNFHLCTEYFVSAVKYPGAFLQSSNMQKYLWTTLFFLWRLPMNSHLMLFIVDLSTKMSSVVDDHTQGVNLDLEVQCKQGLRVQMLFPPCTWIFKCVQ